MAVKAGQGLRVREGNPFEMIIVTFGTIALIFYGITALSTRDPFWLLPNDFDAQPVAIEVYHEGVQSVLTPGSPTFARLVAELNEQVDQQVGYYEVSMRPAAIQEAKERSTAVVFVYDEVLNIRTQWNLGEPTHIFIPVTGSLSGDNMVFTGTGRAFGHGGLILEDLSGLYETVDEYLATR